MGKNRKIKSERRICTVRFSNYVIECNIDVVKLLVEALQTAYNQTD